MKVLNHVASRRKFLEAIGIAAGILAAKPTAWAQGRKEVWIAGKRIKTVDIHAHASIKDVEEVIRGTNLERRIGGPRLLDPSRLAMMDEWGIDVSVISANQYWWDRTDDRSLAADVVPGYASAIAIIKRKARKILVNFTIFTSRLYIV